MPSLDQEVDHVRRFLDIGAGAAARLAPGVSCVIAEHGIEVGDGALAAVFDACVLHEAIVRNPHHAAGDGRGAADQVGFLQDQHALAGARA